ncbi:hypothetical protein SBV1_860011 [Verrucomicrobia bacterium]|nr:hypothetical protein SBV1_860011 [Verrucomicrobiota bacterium]
MKTGDKIQPSDKIARVSGFTLIEVILALAISAIVLAAVCGVFASAVRLREKTSQAVDASLPLTQALATLRRDLQGAVGPSNVLAGDFKCGGATMGEGMGLSSAQGIGLDFFTTTGIINDDEPWGDVQEVYYELMAPLNRDLPGKDLVRYVNRNLLATATPTPEMQRLAGNIESVQFECYDGAQWRPTWDTSMGDTNLPLAVRISFLMAGDTIRLPPLQMIVPIFSQTRTNSVPTAVTGGLP